MNIDFTFNAEVASINVKSKKVIGVTVNQKLETADLFVQEKYVFSIGKSIFDDKSNSIEILKKYYPNKILFETDDSGVSIEHIYEKASQILNVDKNKINSEVQSKLKTIFAENKI